MDSPRQFTAAEQAYYSQLDEDVTAGRIGTVRRGTPRDGSRISDDELDAILRGRPGLGRDHATGTGRSPRRQVRLPERTPPLTGPAVGCWWQDPHGVALTILVGSLVGLRGSLV